MGQADVLDAEDYPDTPQGEAQRWATELAASRKSLEKWQKQARRIVKRYLDERETKLDGDTRVNLFTSNVNTQGCMLYGKTPRVNVDRRFADANDDVARVAAELFQRLLNTDIERDSDGYAQALQGSLSDLQLGGMGVARVRYDADFEEIPYTPAVMHPGAPATEDANGNPIAQVEPHEIAPAIEAHQEVSREDVETDYVYWEDFLYSPARTWREVRWIAFRAQMSRQQLVKRFGAIGKRVGLNSKRAGKDNSDTTKQDPRSRADVWEIWDKDRKCVYWHADGMDSILDHKEDPLGLEGFWPCPRPMMANLTTTAFIPRPDFTLAQDLYDEVDAVSTRITMLERCIKASGVYDSTAGDLARLVNEAGQNEMIPAKNWQVFTSKGGIEGAISWMPIAQFVMALDKLREYRNELKALLYEVTGMSDIMRGATAASETLGAQQIKSKFASVRVQARQDEFARFASDLQNLKAQIISKMFKPETIYERSNAQFGFDQAVVDQAIDLIKNKPWTYRIQVKPEAISMTDFAQMASDATQFVQAISTYMTAAAPLATAVPGSESTLLQIMQAVMARFKFSSTIEGVLDQAIAKADAAAKAAANAPPQPPQQDPKIQAAQIAANTAMQKMQAEANKPAAELQHELVRIQAESSARQREQAQIGAQHQQELLMRENLARERLAVERSTPNLQHGQPQGGGPA